MSEKKSKQLHLGVVLSLVLAGVAFAIPYTVHGSGCRTTECSYNETEVGHCGAWDTSCGCFSNSSGGGRKELACKSDIEN